MQKEISLEQTSANFRSTYWEPEPTPLRLDVERLLTYYAQQSDHNADCVYVMNCYYRAGMTQTSIAARRGVVEGTVRALIGKDLRELRILLRDKFGINDVNQILGK